MLSTIFITGNHHEKKKVCNHEVESFKYTLKSFWTIKHFKIYRIKFMDKKITWSLRCVCERINKAAESYLF